MKQNNDFQLSLVRFINGLGLPLTARLDYLREPEDLVVYPLPGGQVVQRFMDGTQEIKLPFEIAIKSQDQELANALLWTINTALSSFDVDLPSHNHSYVFLGLELTKPFLNAKDEQGYYVYLLDVTGNLEIREEEK